jgi:multiple sugar transport system substrate-binding protein
MYKGKRYTVPTSFYFHAFGLTDAYRDIETDGNMNLDKLMALAEKYPDKKLTYSSEIQDAVMLTDMFIQLSYRDFIDLERKTTDVDNERFISILNKVMTLRDRIATKPDEDFLLRHYSIMKPNRCSYDQEYTLEGDSTNVMSMNGNFDYSDMFLLTDDQGAGMFSSLSLMPAVNVNSNRPQLAADFVKHLLSPEVQSSPELYNAPVSKASYALLYGDAGEGDFEVTDPGSPLEASFDLEKNIEKFNAFTSQLAYGENGDAFISSFIMEELQSFFNGSQTAEQAASNLQSRLNTYLNE